MGCSFEPSFRRWSAAAGRATSYEQRKSQIANHMFECVIHADICAPASGGSSTGGSGLMCPTDSERHRRARAIEDAGARARSSMRRPPVRRETHGSAIPLRTPASRRSSRHVYLMRVEDRFLRLIRRNICGGGAGSARPGSSRYRCGHVSSSKSGRGDDSLERAPCSFR